MRSNKWIPVLAIAAVVCLALGGAFYAAGKVMGARGSWINTFGNTINTPHVYQGEYEDGTFTFEDIKSLKVDLAMTEVTIHEGETWTVSFYHFPKGKFEAKKTNTHLSIRNTMRESFPNNPDFRVEITIPQEAKLEKADINLSMGTLNVDRLHADAMDLEFSMTKVTLSDITAQTVKLESSMGDFDLDGVIEKSCTIDQSMGKVTLLLSGKEEDYYTKIDNSMGSVRVGGKRVDGLSGELSFYESADKSITINNSMGDVELRYR